MNKNLPTPFTIRRSYTTLLSLPEIEAELNRMKYNPVFGKKDHKTVINDSAFRLTVYSTQWPVKISGNIISLPQGYKVEASYRPGLNPLYLFAGVLLIIAYAVGFGKQFTFNGQPSTRLHFALYAAGLFSFFVIIISLMTLWMVTSKRAEMERVLQLDRAKEL